MELKEATIVQWRLIGDKHFLNSTIVSLSDNKVIARLDEKPGKMPKPGVEIIIRIGIDDSFTQVLEVGEDFLAFRRISGDTRSYFRINDSFPVPLRTSKEEFAPRRASIFPVYGLETGEIDHAELQEGMNPRLLRTLTGINAKWSMVLYGIEVMGTVVPDERENPWVWSALETVNKKLSMIMRELNLGKSRIRKAGSREVNLSASGISFTMEEKLNKGDVVELRMLLPSSPPTGIVTLCEVIRAVEGEDGKCHVALNFSDMDESVREELIRYALDRQREQIRSERREW